MALIVEGTNLTDIAGLDQYDGYFAAGDIAELRLNFSQSIGADIAQSLASALAYGGYGYSGITEPHEVVRNGNTVKIRVWTQSPGPWLIVGGILAALIVGALALWFINWQLENIGKDIFGGVGSLLPVAVLAILGYTWATGG